MIYLFRDSICLTHYTSFANLIRTFPVYSRLAVARMAQDTKQNALTGRESLSSSLYRCQILFIAVNLLEERLFPGLL